MESAADLPMRNLMIHIKQNLLNLYQATNFANNGQIQIYKEEYGYDMALCRMENNNILYGVYVEDPPLNLNDNEVVDIRLFLDKYFQRLNKIAPDSDKILVYSTRLLSADDWMTNTNLDEGIVSNSGICLMLNKKTVQKLLSLYGNVPVTKRKQYATFLEKVKFIYYKKQNYTQISIYFLGSKIFRPLVNQHRMNLILLKKTFEYVNGRTASKPIGINEIVKLNKTCKGLSEFNVTFINQLLIKFGISSQKMWGPIFDDTSIHIVFVDSISPLFSVTKVVEYVSRKGLNFMLLSAKQLRLKDISTKAFSLIFNGEVDVLIIECDEDMKRDDHPLPVDLERTIKIGKIIEISYVIDYTDNLPRKIFKDVNKKRQQFIEHLKYIRDDITYKDLDESSLLSLLNARIRFQDFEINLEEIANLTTIEKCMNWIEFEDLIVGWDFKVGAEIKLNFNGPIYLQRTVRRKILPDQVLKTNLVNSSIVIIFGEHLDKLKITEQLDVNSNAGIITVSGREEAFQKYCERITNTNVYLVEYKNGFLFLETCKTFDWVIIDSLEDVALAEQISTDDLLSRNKTNLIIGNPGMGKSVFLNYLAIQLKKKYPHVWVVYINLGNDTTYVQHIFNTMEKFNFDSDIEECAVQFFVPSAIGASPDYVGWHFSKEVFKLGFKSGSTECKYPNYIFLFDAFDELIAKHQQKAISLFRFLISKNFPVWITSRPNQKYRLEEELQTVALSMNPLIDTQKKEYFKNHYNKHYIKMSYQEFSFRMESLLLYLENKNDMFASYPLHLTYLTTFHPSLKELYYFLERFIYYKFNVYYQQKIPIKGFKVTKQISSMFKSHCNIALSICDFNDILKIKYRITQDELSRVGLVTSNGNEHTFIHPFVKYYFVAYSAINYPHMLVRILSEEKLQNVRFILNEMTYKRLWQVNLEYWKVDKAFVVFKNLVREGHKNLAKLVVRRLFEKQIIKNLQNQNHIN